MIAANVNKNEHELRIENTKRQILFIVTNAAIPKPMRIHTRIILANSTAPNAAHPLFVHVVLVYLK